MFYQSQFALPFFTALTLSTAPIVRGEPIPEAPLRVCAFSIQNVVDDLTKRHNRLAAEFAKSASASHTQSEKATESGMIENMKASSEISQCLMARGSSPSRPEIPTDPLYSALKNQRIADRDLKIANVWWQYCKEDSAYRSLKVFDDWPLAAQLKAEKAQADAEFSALASKPVVARSRHDNTVIDLDPSMAAK